MQSLYHEILLLQKNKIGNYFLDQQAMHTAPLMYINSISNSFDHNIFLHKLPCFIPVWFRQHWEDLLHPGIWFGWLCVDLRLNNTIMDEIFTEIMEEKEDELKIKKYEMIKVQVFKESHKTYDKISHFLQCLIWEISSNFCGLMRKYIVVHTHYELYNTYCILNK